MSDTDGDLKTPLERAHYAAGMMLDIDTIRSEQDYHRRRLNRHRYWYAGSGTIAGLAVSLRAEAPPNAEDNAPVLIVVGPGAGIDGLGRDIQVSGPHCMDLLEWMLADGRSTESLRDGLDETARKLHLTVSARYADCPGGLRPVLARKLNASTDPVDVASVRDSVELALSPGAVPEPGTGFWPWAALPRPGTDPLEEASDVEKNLIGDLGGADRSRAELTARLIYGLRDDSTALDSDRDIELIAAIPLAQISIDLHPDNRPFVHPDHVTVNNLVRPMIPTAAQLEWLARQAV